MAEKGAYLTGTVYNKPTIFEILAQKSLASTLEPAFKKVLSVRYITQYFLNLSSYVTEKYVLKKNRFSTN